MAERRLRLRADRLVTRQILFPKSIAEPRDLRVIRPAVDVYGAGVPGVFYVYHWLPLLWLGWVGR